MSARFSLTIMQGTLVFPDITVSMIEASAIRKPCSPCTRRRSSTTWYKLIRERGWRRPRHRVHPVTPKHSVRADRPDKFWQVDTTVIKLLDHTKMYLHAVIDNFSRKILAWRVCEKLEFATTVIILKEAALKAVSADAVPTAVVDAGVDNLNAGVDE